VGVADKLQITLEWAKSSQDVFGATLFPHWTKVQFPSSGLSCRLVQVQDNGEDDRGGLSDLPGRYAIQLFTHCR
jgi:hypothetical protein